MEEGIIDIQYAGKTGWVNSVVIKFVQDDGEDPNLKVSSNEDGGEVHATIKRAIESHYGFSFEIVGCQMGSERKNEKLVFGCCVVIDFQGRRLAGRGEAEDMLLAFARACEDAAQRIPKFLDSQEMHFRTEEQVQVPEEETCPVFALS